MRHVLPALFALTAACSSADPVVFADQQDSDTAATDTAGADTSSAAMDSGTTAEAAVDAPADVAATEESLCKGGAPRLEWKDGKCWDHGFTIAGDTATLCAFQLAEDGPKRCLPEPHGNLIGGRTEDCAFKDGPRLMDAVIPPPDTRHYTVSIEQSDGRYATYDAQLCDVSMGWHQLVVGSRICQSAPAAFAVPMNSYHEAVCVSQPALDLSKFYAVPGT